jgi:hypothetical protein
MGEFIVYPHAPPYLFVSESMYMVTAGTYQAKIIFNSDLKLQALQECLLGQAVEYSLSFHC